MWWRSSLNGRLGDESGWEFFLRQRRRHRQKSPTQAKLERGNLESKISGWLDQPPVNV
jgi:hypothetical protein